MAESKRSLRSHGGVNALTRGLQVLEVLNSNRGLSTSGIARACQLPRTTTIRLLLTLTKHGFARRDRATRKYAPGSRALSLASGISYLDVLTEQAEEALHNAAPEVCWPMDFATRDALSMKVRSSTDIVSPLAVHKLMPGTLIPLLQCASGLAWLGSQNDATRDEVIEQILRGGNDAQWTRNELERELRETRDRGFAVFRKPARLTAMVGMSVPVRLRGHGTATLGVRFAERAVPLNTAEREFLPLLKGIASRLEASQQSATR